jgi:hypothetical protein
MSTEAANNEASAGTGCYAEVEHRLTCAIGILAGIQFDEGIDHEDVINELREARAQIHRRSGGWVPVEHATPEEGHIVVMRTADGRMIHGAYCYIADIEAWKWCIQCGHCWVEGDHWEGDSEWDDDYDVTHWHKLPVFPEA